MNTLYYGDNLEILRRYIRDESVDLVYLDPPFNSNATYNVLFSQKGGTQSSAQIQAFEDTWQWDENSIQTYTIEVEKNGAVADALRAFKLILGDSNMMAYLTMMAPHLQELQRVLKSTGSLYLHCDPTASHYLKVLLDMVFGAENFRNEIIWKRSHGHNSALRYGANHDVILFYGKTEKVLWNTIFHDYDKSYTDKHYRHIAKDGRRYKHENPTGAGVSKGVTGLPWRGVDPTAKGRHWARTPDELEKLEKVGLIYWPDKIGAWPYIINYLDEKNGVPGQDLWTDVDPINMMAAERLGYPTQKPLALLERIIQASSNPGDVVLDPFCGCGTAIAAAQKKGRNWIGIDITHLAIGLIKRRMVDAYGECLKYEVIGEPTTLEEAVSLANQDKYQFQ